MNDVLVYRTIEIMKIIKCDIIIVYNIQNLRIPYAHIANGKPVY